MEAKLDFQFGKLSFSGQGTEAWLTKQLEYILSKIPDLSDLPQMQEVPESDKSAETPQPQKNNVGSLASHIKSHGGDTNQNQRFLATADWLRLKGEKALKTSMISKSLKDNQQKKLGNPADNLNQNVGKGYCEKTADGFFITPEGLEHLGHND